MHPLGNCTAVRVLRARGYNSLDVCNPNPQFFKLCLSTIIQNLVPLTIESIILVREQLLIRDHL